jgi:hypothetical protein
MGFWPPRSPDLTPPDFFLWGFFKQRACCNNPRILEDLKNNTEQPVAGKLFEKLQKHCEKSKYLPAKWWGRFTAFYVLRYSLLHSWHVLKK